MAHELSVAAATWLTSYTGLTVPPFVLAKLAVTAVLLKPSSSLQQARPLQCGLSFSQQTTSRDSQGVATPETALASCHKTQARRWGHCKGVLLWQAALLLPSTAPQLCPGTSSTPLWLRFQHSGMLCT